MNNQKHAKLSASGSQRWLNCAGSVEAESYYKDKTSVFAQEGTHAHTLAEHCLKRCYGNTPIGNTFYIDDDTSISGVEYEEMCENIQPYLDYVRSCETKTSELFIEKRVDYSNYVPEGFGTVDACIIDWKSKTVHVIDLKYGKGLPEYAEKNTQGMLYALGILNDFGWLGGIDKFVIHIVQPRKNNFSSWGISTKDLKEFGEYAKERAHIALSKNAPRTPGEKQCRWCKAKADCAELAKFTQETICADFDDLSGLKGNVELNNNQKRKILDNKKLIESFLKAVHVSVQELIESGETFEGYKVIRSKGNRTWNDDAEKKLVEMFGQSAYVKKLMGVTAADKIMDKETLANFVHRPEGKTSLVKESAKGEAIIFGNIVDDFEGC